MDISSTKDIEKYNFYTVYTNVQVFSKIITWERKQKCNTVQVSFADRECLHE